MSDGKRSERAVGRDQKEGGNGVGQLSLSKRHKRTTDDWYVPHVVCACVNCTFLPSPAWAEGIVLCLCVCYHKIAVQAQLS